MRQIGTGGHSTVRLASRNLDNKQVVVKTIHSTNVWHWTSSKCPLEISMMQQFNGLTGVIEYVEHYQIGARFIIVMEYLGSEWIDLYDYIEIFGPVGEQRAISIFKKVVKIIQMIHGLGYCHNDIKGISNSNLDENVMINKRTLEVKLIDFGSTIPLTYKKTTTFYGTQKFSSPEALGGNAYVLSEQEVWTIGTLLYVLLFKMDPFGGDEEILSLNIGERIERLQGGPSVKDCPTVVIGERSAEAIKDMLNKDPLERPKIKDLLAYFN